MLTVNSSGTDQIEEKDDARPERQAISRRRAGVDPKRAKGVEPCANQTVSEENQQIVEPGAPKALPAVCPPVTADADLRLIVERWAALPADVRSTILSIVKLSVPPVSR